MTSLNLELDPNQRKAHLIRRKNVLLIQIGLFFSRRIKL